MTSRLPLACLAALLTATSGHAAVVQLVNGDRLSGEILSRDDGSVTLESTVFGKVVVKNADVLAVEEEPAPAEPPPPPPPPPGFWARINPLAKWESNLNVGIGFLSGNKESKSSTIAFDTERKWETQELRFELLQQYEVTTDDGEDNVTKNMLKVLGRYRHDISERFFLQSETRYGYDNVKAIDTDLRESVGLGWRAVDRERFSLTLTPAFTAQYQVVEGESLDVIWSPTFFEELVWKVNGATDLRQEFSILFPVNGDVDPSWHAGITLKRKLSEIFSLNLLYMYDYDGTVSDDVEAGQQSLNVMLGASF